MRQPEHQHHQARVQLQTQTHEATQILECLVYHRQSDDCVHDIRIGMNTRQHTKHQRCAMAQSEHWDIQRHILQAIQKKDHARQKQEMVIPGNHMLGTKIQIGNECDTLHSLDITGIALRHAMRKTAACWTQKKQVPGNNWQIIPDISRHFFGLTQWKKIVFFLTTQAYHMAPATIPSWPATFTR